jgi:rubrerythrin
LVKYEDTEVYGTQMVDWRCGNCGHYWKDTPNIHWLECPNCKCVLNHK